MPHVTPGDVHVPQPLGARRERKADEDDDLIEEEEVGKSHSPEYLAAYYDNARKVLQGWQHDQIHTMAMPSSGGAAGRRKPEHTEVERALLAKLRPSHVKGLEDEALTKAWGEIERWHRLAARKGLDTADYERAATVIADELERRGTVQIDPDSHLAQVVMAKAAGLVLPECAIVQRSAGPEPIARAWKEKQIIWYAMGVPGEVDTYGDQISREDVEDACHRYMQNGCLICIEHGELVGLNAAKRWPKILSPTFAVCVESGIAMEQVNRVFGEPLPKPLPEGTWYTANLYKDRALWELLKSTPHGGSWRGTARRRRA